MFFCPECYHLNRQSSSETRYASAASQEFRYASGAVGISRFMAGTLHIFKRNDSPLEYQANYNLGATSWVQVFDPVGLDHFLQIGSGLTGEQHRQHPCGPARPRPHQRGPGQHSGVAPGRDGIRRSRPATIEVVCGWLSVVSCQFMELRAFHARCRLYASRGLGSAIMPEVGRL